MKVFRYVIWLLLPFFVSCEKWLEENPRANQDLDDLAKTEEGIDILAVGAYSALQPLYNFSNNPGVVGTDECMTLAINQTRAKPLDQYIFTPSNDIFQNAWDKHYAAIQHANIVIERAQQAEMSDSIRLKTIAEMRFLRAFLYFRMVQWFGELPLITQETPGYDETVTRISRAPIKDVYELIASDLEFAASGQILRETTSDGRVTRSAAKALLAKVYLTMGTAKERTLRLGVVPGYRDLPLEPREYYRKCYLLTEDLIESGLFSLAPSYGDLFLPEKKNSNRESIWEIQFSNSGELGSSWSKYFGLIGSGGQLYTFNAMIGRHIYQPVPGLVGYYKRGDRRYAWNIKDYQVNIADNEATGSVTKSTLRMNALTSWAPEVLNEYLGTNLNLTNQIGCSKYRWGNGNDPEAFYLDNYMNERYAWDNCPNNVIVLRYADVILMFAEADLLLNGGTPSLRAVELVNELLYRARDGKTEEEMLSYPTNNQGEYVSGTISDSERPYYLYDYTPSTLTYDELKKERARELCFEFHRWNDLVRWGDLESAVNNRLHAEDAEITKSVVDPKKHYLFPIPQNEIDVSHIEQNPHYGASTENI